MTASLSCPIEVSIAKTTINHRRRRKDCELRSRDPEERDEDFSVRSGDLNLDRGIQPKKQKAN
jgi:hypothetical protein